MSGLLDASNVISKKIEDLPQHIDDYESDSSDCNAESSIQGETISPLPDSVDASSDIADQVADQEADQAAEIKSQAIDTSGRQKLLAKRASTFRVEFGAGR